MCVGGNSWEVQLLNALASWLCASVGWQYIASYSYTDSTAEKRKASAGKGQCNGGLGGCIVAIGLTE